MYIYEWAHYYTEGKVLQKICCQVRNRVVGKGKFKATDENVAVCISWGLAQKKFVLMDIGVC